jgi:hypothetical protein
MTVLYGYDAALLGTGLGMVVLWAMPWAWRRIRERLSHTRHAAALRARYREYLESVSMSDDPATWRSHLQ